MSDIIKISSPLSVVEMLTLRDKTLDMLPPSIEDNTRRDGDYHFQARDRWVELNQVETPRNLRYHMQVLDWIAQGAVKDTVILELGGGVGYDAEAFLEKNKEFRAYIFSELSPEFANEVRRIFPDDLPVITCALDAASLNISDHQVDVLFMIAAFHHISQAEQALKEFDRVVKPGGWIIFGIEPNRFWTGWMLRLKPLYRSVFPVKDHSIGDESAEGFRIEDFHRAADSRQWKVINLVPVWFLAGFIHYGLEALYRVFRLKRRLVLPTRLENLILRIDDAVLKLPYLDRLAWHYSVRFQKRPLNGA